MLLGLGWPQWLTIIGLVGGLILTFKMMARASIAYEKARKAKDRLDDPSEHKDRLDDPSEHKDRLDDPSEPKEET